jgi:hypothetical protein
MISNLDWSTTFQHNAKTMLQPTNRYIPLAYDFDMSGFVNPPYGVPNEELGQADIRDRIYRGFCRQEPVVQAVRQHYLSKQADVMGVLASYEKSFAPKEYSTMKKYLDDFWAIMRSDGDFKKRIVDGCRKVVFQVHLNLQVTPSAFGWPKPNFCHSVTNGPNNPRAQSLTIGQGKTLKTTTMGKIIGIDLREQPTPA